MWEKINPLCLITNSPNCLPYNSYDVTSENVVSVGSTNNPSIDSPLYSYHLRARSCIDIVMRNSVLVTHGHSYVKPNTLKVSFSWYSRMFFICMEKAKGTSTFYPKTMKWDKDTHYTQIKLLPAKTLILLFATTNLHTKIAYFTMGHRASGTKQTAH